MQHWYAVHTKPHKERQVEAVLSAHGIDVYFPVVPEPRSKNRFSKSAFFPCYLFARADLDVVGIWSIHFVPGARGVIESAGVPAKIDDAVIEGIRNRLTQIDAVYCNGDWLQQGDRVVITSGPLANIEAVFDKRLSPTGRVRVLINWLQRGIPVELDSANIRKTIPRFAHSSVT